MPPSTRGISTRTPTSTSLSLDTQNRDRGYRLVSVAKTVVCPMGFYSKKIGNIDDLKDGSKVSVPNDPANVGRALALLEQKGL